MKSSLFPTRPALYLYFDSAVRYNFWNIDVTFVRVFHYVVLQLHFVLVVD